VTCRVCQDAGCLKNGLDFCPNNVCGDTTRDSNRHVQPLDGSQPLYTLYDQHFGDLPTSIFSSLISSVARGEAFPSVYILPNHTRVHSCAHAINSHGHTFRQSTLLHQLRTTARKLIILIHIHPLLIQQYVAVHINCARYKRLIH